MAAEVETKLTVTDSEGDVLTACAEQDGEGRTVLALRVHADADNPVWLSARDAAELVRFIRSFAVANAGRR